MKIKTSILAILLFIPILVFTQNKEEFFRTGYQFLVKGENEEAIEYFTKAIQLDPKYGDAYYTRGVSYSQMDKYQRAIADFNATIKFSEKNIFLSGAYMEKAFIYRNRIKDLDKALANTTNAIKIDSLSPQIMHLHGLILHDMKEYHKAIEYYDKAISFDRSDPNPYYDRAIAKRKLNLLEEAIKDYDLAIELDPKYVRAYNNRGFAKTLLEKYSEAIEDFDKSLEIEVSSYSHNNRGYAKLKNGDLEGAKLDCELAIELDENNSWAHHYLGLVYFEMGKHEEACKSFHKAVELGKEEVIEDIKQKCKNLPNKK